jgi:hypothetical protein
MASLRGPSTKRDLSMDGSRLGDSLNNPIYNQSILRGQQLLNQDEWPKRFNQLPVSLLRIFALTNSFSRTP